MLSVVDLVKAGTLGKEQAAWLLEEIWAGSSFLVGANPGGAGKTAVMGALLTMLPDTPEVHLTSYGGRWKRAEPGSCLVAYEISPASFEAYIWGDDVRQLTELGRNGCRIISNLHADTLGEARSQVAEECGAGEGGFQAFSLFLPINTGGRGFRMQRVVEEVYRAEGGRWQRVERGKEPSSAERNAIEAFLDRCVKEESVRIEEVREAWLTFLASELPGSA
jgi:hypothetical protein